MVSPNMACKNFVGANSFFHLHGGISIDLETPDLSTADESFVQSQHEIEKAAEFILTKVLDKDLPPQEQYPARTYTAYNDKKYIVLPLELETYYPQAPRKPKWVRIMAETMAALKPKKLPLSDAHLHEQFKKYLGLKKAIKHKSLPLALKTTAQNGWVSMFQTLRRKCPPARLSKQDEHGLSLMHYAALYNRPSIIAELFMLGMDVNIRRHSSILSTGPTPLHLATRCGCLEAAACLLANCDTNQLLTDTEGWAPIHYAAYFDHEPVIKLLIKKQEELIELLTKNEFRSTALLLASSSGALSSVKCLIKLGANIERRDEEGNGIVQLAALRYHTNILEYFIEWNHPEVRVWSILVEMLSCEKQLHQECAVKCLEVLSISAGHHWQFILEAAGIPALVKLLQSQCDNLIAIAASVLCNISQHEAVRVALTESGACQILISLLSSKVDDIQSRASTVLSDLACVLDNQTSIAAMGGIPPLINLLDSEYEDVLVNAVNAVRVLCVGNVENQEAVVLCDAIPPLVEFLTAPSEILQASTSHAIAALTERNRVNQNKVVAEGAVQPLVELIRGRNNITVQVKAASAVEALCDDNETSQASFLQLEADKALLKLLKVWTLEVKEQGACALWALAGRAILQQKYIAERIGIQLLIEILMTKSEKLQFVGCMAVIALCRENIENQDKIVADSGIQPLIRLLRSPKTSNRVLLIVIKTIGILCLGVAHRNNPKTQKELATYSCIPILLSFLENPPTNEIRVEIGCTLGCLVLGNKQNQDILKSTDKFKFEIYLDMLKSDDETVRLMASDALAIFAFNNTMQQFSIREAGGIPFAVFEKFLTSTDNYQRCHASFQIVVLARDIVGLNLDQVRLTATGLSNLSSFLNSADENIVILSAGYLSSLAHTRAGIPDAMVACGVVEQLVQLLTSHNSQIRSAAAVALGYLTFNKTAARILLKACRESPKLFDEILENVKSEAPVCEKFQKNFERAKHTGFPTVYLEKNGGPFIATGRAQSAKPRALGTRGQSRLSKFKEEHNSTESSRVARTKSAPAHMHRTESLPPEASTDSIPETAELHTTANKQTKLLRRKTKI